MTSQKFRTQHQNLEDAIAKLSQFLEVASEVPREPSKQTKARIKALKRKAERIRRSEKKYHSDKKSERNSPLH